MASGYNNFCQKYAGECLKIRRVAIPGSLFLIDWMLNFNNLYYLLLQM
jgi:hypothetical protein